MAGPTPLHERLLKGVLITPELFRRRKHELDRVKINTAIHKLSTLLKGSEQELMEELVRTTLALCNAGTAGLSLLCKTGEGEEVFRWDALSGALAHAVGGTTPANWSPCGTTLERRTPQLFSHPGRCFEYFNDAMPAIVEGLVVPICVERAPIGTLWIASHDEDRKFDSEDLDVLTRLANFYSAAIRIMRRRQQAKEAAAP